MIFYTNIWILAYRGKMNIVKNILFFEIYILHILLVFFYIVTVIRRTQQDSYFHQSLFAFDPCIDNVCLKCEEQFDQIRLSCGSHTICCSAYRLAVLISRNNCIQCTHISCMVRLVINYCTIQNLF